MSCVLHLNKKIEEIRGFDRRKFFFIQKIEENFIPHKSFFFFFFIRIILIKDNFIYNRRKVDERITKNYIQKRQGLNTHWNGIASCKTPCPRPVKQEPTKVVRTDSLCS